MSVVITIVTRQCEVV